MIVLLVLLIWPTVVYGTPQIEATLERHGLGGAEELGRAVNLRKIDLLGNFQQSEASIFVDVPSKCFKTQASKTSTRNWLSRQVWTYPSSPHSPWVHLSPVSYQVRSRRHPE